MGQVSIGELVVTIRGDNRQLQQAVASTVKELEKVKTGTKQTEDQAAKSLGNMVGRWVGVAVAVKGASAAVQQFQQVMGQTAELDRLSQLTGAAVERLDSLRQVAAQNGVEFTTFSQVIGQFGNRVREAVANPAGATAQAYRLLGIELRNTAGHLKGFEELLPEISDRLSRYSDGIQKAQLTTALLGEEGGPRFTRMLNQSSTSLEAQRRQLEATGRVMTQEGIIRAREYEAAIVSLRQEWDKWTFDIASSFLPMLTEASRVLQDFFNHARRAGAGFAPEDTLGELGAQLHILQRRAAQLRTELEERPPGTGQGILGITQALRTELADIERRTSNVLARMAELANPVSSGALGKGPEPGPDLAERQRQITLINEQLGMMQNALSGMPILYQQAFGDTGAWSEPFLQAMDKIQKAQDMGAISAQRAAQMRIDLQKREQDEMLNTASLAASTLTTVFNKSKAASIAAAIINTAVGVTKALSSSPPPFNFINAALVAASGAAQLASIRSTSQSGGGGIAPVSGGGGDDGSSGGGAGNGGGGSAELFVRGLDAPGMFSAEVVRDLAERIVQHQRDGGTVVLDRPRS